MNYNFSPSLVPSWSLAEFVEEFRWIHFFSKAVRLSHYNEKKDYIMIKNVSVELYLLDIVNTLKPSHASKMLDIVRICVDNINETLVCVLRRPNNEQVIQCLS